MPKLESFDFKNSKVDVYCQKPDLDHIIELNQTHSNNVLTLQEYDKDTEADGIIASYKEAKGKNFAIKTADCMPILLLGSESFAFVHAGWRGVFNKISINTQIQELNIHTIFIGPSIQADSFVVTEDFKEYFPNSLHFNQKRNSLTFDLQREIYDQCKEIYPTAKIIDCAQCTYKQTKYNSFRRDKTQKRNWNMFSIKYNK